MEKKATVVVSGSTKSCGCLASEAHKRLKLGSATLSVIYSDYRRGAKGRGLVFSLTKDQFLYICKQPCHYCGIEPQPKGYPYCSDGATFCCNGIDRKDNSVGYTVDNCLPCCKLDNRGKLDATYDEYTSHLDRVALFRKSKVSSSF